MLTATRCVVISSFCCICLCLSAGCSRTPAAEDTVAADTAGINDLVRRAQGLLRTDIHLADSLARTAYALLPSSGYDEGLVNCLLLLSYTNSRAGSNEEGFAQCREAIEISERIDDRKLISRSYNQLYLLYFQEGKYDSATLAAERSLSIAREIMFTNMMARGEQNFGVLNSVRGNHATAIEHYLESEKLYTELGDDFALTMLLGNIGVTFSEAGNTDKALEYMYKELAASRRIMNEELEAWSLVNIGSVHSQSGSADSAFYYYNLSLDLAGKVDNPDLMITTLDNLGSHYSAVGEHAKATGYLKTAYALAEEKDYDYQNVYTSGHMAENYLAQGELDSARQFAEIQLTLATEYDFLYDQKLAYSILSRIYRQQGEYAKAYDALASQTAIGDSIFNEEKSQQIEALRETYETEKKDNTIQLLRQKGEAAEFRKWVFVSAAVLIGAVFLLLYFRERSISRRNRRLLEKEQDLERMKSRFFTNISHEFRTPLTLILGPIELLQSAIQEARLKMQMDVLKRNAKRLLTLINQLLDLSQLESGKLRLQVMERDILPVILGVTHSFDSMAEMKGIALSTNLQAPQLPVCFDREKLETILTNLLSNAFKFTPDGGRIEVDVQRAKGSQIDCCRITVRDTGCGVPGEEMREIFNLFSRSSSARRGVQTGTGVGLALVRELIELHGGAVDVTSDESSGTEVTVSLPLGSAHLKDHDMLSPDDAKIREDSYRVDDTNGTSGRAYPEAADAGPDSPLLLVVEDSEDVMRYLTDILSESYRLLAAVNGETGIEMAIEHIPDLIISDIMLPGKDGFGVSSTLKENEKTSHIPIILLTARATVEDKIRGLETKADDYLTKPFVPQELMVRVRNLIESRKQLREKFNRHVILKPGDMVVSSVDEVFLTRVMKVIDENLDDENFSMDQLGKGVGMSRSQIHRKLQALTNQSATQFIRSYRLNRAMDLIRQNAGSVSEIAYSVGFSSPSYFNRCFMQHFGCTPTDAKKGAAKG